MQLKEIKIKGFKSFANKIKLNITPGITVIVGPNGCGKSNITDAVRWILGEQNIRSLRGSNLTDMIFSGNSEQKMRNIAEVSILFDNVDRKLSIDSEEVELKRIIYRSGETENYINGISCKLRDIHELFWGTGLGKNSYSIIAQGKVDFVLNAKPSERRILFEEASNISSYKNKKDAAIKKLEHTQDNLLRVNDILSEVKENLLHYQNKADDLKAYQFYRDNIRKLELYLLSQQYLLYQKNTKKFDDKLSTINQEISKIEKIIIANKEEIHQKEQRKIHLEKQLNDSENHFQQSEKEKNDISNQLIVLQQKIKEISQRTVNLHEDIEDAKKQFVKFKDTLANIDKDIKETIQNSNLAKERCQRNDIFLQKYHVLFTYYEERISNIEENSRKLNKRYLSQYREKIIKEETLLKSSNMSLDDINREKKIINAKINNNCKEIENTEEKKIFYEKEIKQLKEERKRIEKLLADSKLFINTETKKVQNYSNDILLKNKEKDFLDELIKNQQDINTDIKKEILENNLENIQLLEGIHDIVNQVPDSLKKLISFLLKDKMPLIRIAHLDKIPIIIDKYLQKNSIGQIKVISDDIISKENFQKRTKELKYIMDKDSILGFANQLISYPPEYKKIFEVLLGNILVVKNMETAFKLVEKFKEQWVIASLDGVIIDFNGIITLNYLSEDRKYSEHIPRERIKKLEQEIKYIDAEKKKIQDNLNLRKNDNQKLFGKYEKIERQLEDYTSRLYKQDNYLFEINRKITDLKNQLTSLNNKERVEEEKREELEKNISIFRLRIRQIEEHVKSFYSYLQLLKRLRDLSAKNIEKIKNNLETIKMELTWNEERGTLLQKQKNEMNNFIQNYHKEEQKRQEKIVNLKKEKSLLIEQEIKIKEKQENIFENIKLLNEDRMKKKKSIKELESLISKTRETIEVNQEKLEEKKNRYHENEMYQVQNQEKMNHLLNTVKNQYNTSIDEILLHQNGAKNQKEATGLIAKYQEKISLMGQINFDALQEYQKQSDRYNELQSKKEEIVNSKEKLINLIDEIDRIAEDHFYQTYLKVERYFNDIFQKLFRGGQISLELTNDKKLLETGIEVMVQPPGKKLQNISLLSTGEKALTAIALLFALWKANPSPFCFFDEIDSALDEANSLRLASFLKNEDLKEAQIIVITHQKEVMEAADALYGITMEGSGISKLMSVKMLDTGV